MNDEAQLAFLFVFNSISFSYWGEPKWAVEHKRGTWDIITSIGRAIKEGKPVFDPAYLKQLSEGEFEDILRGNNNTRIPLLEERLQILRQLGITVAQQYGGLFTNTVTTEDAAGLVDTIIGAFPVFQDYAWYKGQKVYFNKRAQLLVSDINYTTKRKLNRLNRIDQITACADYILPLVLRYHGVLEYSIWLAGQVDQKIRIPAGSEEEVEIRANTIQAVELIKQEMQKRNKPVTSMQINDYLWLAGDTIPEHQQHHRTRTIAY